MLKSEQLRRLHLLQMAVLRLLCKPEKKSVIYKILMGELSKARQCGHMSMTPWAENTRYCLAISVICLVSGGLTLD